MPPDRSKGANNSVVDEAFITDVIQSKGRARPQKAIPKYMKEMNSWRCAVDASPRAAMDAHHYDIKEGNTLLNKRELRLELAALDKTELP